MDQLKTDLASLRDAYSKAPYIAKVQLDAYVPPLLALLEKIINRLEEVKHGATV